MGETEKAAEVTPEPEVVEVHPEVEETTTSIEDPFLEAILGWWQEGTITLGKREHTAWKMVKGVANKLPPVDLPDADRQKAEVLRDTLRPGSDKRFYSRLAELAVIRLGELAGRSESSDSLKARRELGIFLGDRETALDIGLQGYKKKIDEWKDVVKEDVRGLLHSYCTNEQPEKIRELLDEKLVKQQVEGENRDTDKYELLPEPSYLLALHDSAPKSCKSLVAKALLKSVEEVIAEEKLTRKGRWDNEVVREAIKHLESVGPGQAARLYREHNWFGLADKAEEGAEKGFFDDLGAPVTVKVADPKVRTHKKKAYRARMKRKGSQPLYDRKNASVFMVDKYIPDKRGISELEEYTTEEEQTGIDYREALKIAIARVIYDESQGSGAVPEGERPESFILLEKLDRAEATPKERDDYPALKYRACVVWARRYMSIDGKQAKSYARDAIKLIEKLNKIAPQKEKQALVQLLQSSRMDHDHLDMPEEALALASTLGLDAYCHELLGNQVSTYNELAQDAVDLSGFFESAGMKDIAKSYARMGKILEAESKDALDECFK